MMPWFSVMNKNRFPSPPSIPIRRNSIKKVEHSSIIRSITSSIVIVRIHYPQRHFLHKHLESATIGLISGSASTCIHQQRLEDLPSSMAQYVSDPQSGHSCVEVLC